MRKILRPVFGCLLILLVTAACSLGSGQPTAQSTVPAFAPTLPTLSVDITPTILIVPTMDNQTPIAPSVQPTVNTGATGVTGSAALPTNSNAAGSVAIDTTGTTSGTCTPPTGWVSYTVQPGDTVSSLAAQFGISTAQLAAANCLADADVINVDQSILLPAKPVAAGAANTNGSNTNSGRAVSNNSTSNTGGDPAVENLWVEPATVQNNGQYQVTFGSTVTLRARGVTNAAKITFVLQPIGSAAAPLMLGTDTNLTDGISVPWLVNDANMNANVWAIVTNSAGASTQSQPIVLVSHR